jgi:predicted DNA-binding transcriptional regulator AlpA
MDATILMDKTEVAAMFRVKPRTISYWVQYKGFPEPVRTGKKPLWIQTELEAHLHAAKQDKPAMPKPEPRAKGGRAAKNSAELQTMLAALRARQMQKPAKYPRG